MFRGMVRVVTERERREEDGSYGFTSQAPVVHGGLPWWRCPLWVAASSLCHECARNGRDSRTTSFLPGDPRNFSLSLKSRLENKKYGAEPTFVFESVSNFATATWKCHVLGVDVHSNLVYAFRCTKNV